ncbi:MAG TPA: N-acetylmuramoyl-L-alanine amidase [Candidatus Acidoferrales bacterium]|nr:N-acetylmuramoyl-L-alanine amidase [Candidatus Acidoferrales bacterium]
MRQDLRLNAAPVQPSPFPERSNLLSQPLARFPALRLSITLLVCLLAAVMVLPADGAKADAKRDAAKNQFQKAERQRIALQGKPQNQRTIEEYTQLVAAFRRVYLITPHATQVPQALLAVAELYQEMGRRFDAKYYQSAVDAYQFLLHEYPESRYKQDALLTIARIQKDDLEQYDLAQKSFEEFLARYQRSERAAEARRELAEIAEARENLSKPKSREKLTEQLDREKQLPQVTRIRTWNAENYTRIVVDVEDHVKYQAARISGPDRIYFDLTKAKLNSALAGKTIDVQGGGFLKNVRVAQNQAGVVRVVLEVEKVKDYSVFLLPNPYRLVVDVYGQPGVTRSAGRVPEPAKTAKPQLQAQKTEVTRNETSAVKTAGGESKQQAKLSDQTAKTGVVQVPAESAVTATSTLPPAPVPDVAKVEPRPDSITGGETARKPPGKSGSENGTLPARESAAKIGPPAVPAPTKNGQHSLTRALGLKIGRIVIDPGHGGHDTGTIGPSGLMEKDLCLDVAIRLGRLFEKRLPGAEVIFTRQDDSFVPLEERTAIANQAKADLFLSIHANSSQDHSVRGVETYYLNFSASGEAMEVASRENALAQGSIHELQELVQKIARNEKIEESREFATEVQVALARRLLAGNHNFKNRGVRKAPFVVLIGANMPSVLSEISFLSNHADERMLKRPDNRQRIAEGLYHGVESYLRSINSLTYNQPKPAPNSR